MSRGFAVVLELLRNLARQKRLLRGLVVRDLKARYVGSSMGFFWSVLYPLISLAIYSFVFRAVLHARFHDKASTGETVLLMFAGILVWASFAETVSRCTNSLVENANLIQKVVFPSEVLAPSLAISSIVNMSIGLPLVLAGTLWVGYISPADGAQAGAAPSQTVDVAQLDSQEAPTPPRNPALQYTDHEHRDVAPRAIAFGPGLAALPLLVALQMVFVVGLGYFLSAFNLFLRDTFHLIGVFLTVWMFTTPIFYAPELVTGEGFGWLLKVNPMHWLIASYREVLLYGHWPSAGMIVPFAAVAALVFWLGGSFFQAQKARFPDLL